MSHAAVTSYAMPAMAAARAPRPSGAGTPVVEVSRSGAVAGDLACRRCSANLRGLAVTSVCRECGARVGVSLYGELLKYGHPQWVRDLGRGAASAGGGVLLVLASVLIGETIAGTAGRWLGPIAGMVGAILLVRGAWLLAAADPAEQVGVGPATARLAVRLAPCAGVLSFGWPVVILAMPGLANLPWLTPAVVLAACLFAAGQAALISQVWRLAMRIPNAALARRAFFVRRGYIGSLAVTTLLPLMPRAVLATRFAAYTTILGVVALLVFGVIFAVVLQRARRAFAIQADFARGISARTLSAVG